MNQQEILKKQKNLLKKGKTVRVSSGCIGHSMHCAEQENFKKELEKIYSNKLVTNISMGACRYSYNFKLK